MLEDGVRGLIYAGDQDLICNWLGNRRWVDALQWRGAERWAAEKGFEWSVDGSNAGQVHEAGPLAFVKVYGAGHMVRLAADSLLFLRSVAALCRCG
jgi:serine carboxypeptidase-like clade IV